MDGRREGKGKGEGLSRVLVYYKSDQKSIRNNAVQCSVEGLLTSEPSMRKPISSGVLN